MPQWLPELKDRAGDAVLGAVDKSVTSRWAAAQRRAAATTGVDTASRVREVKRAFRAELSMAGAAAGATSAVPAVTTPAAVVVGIAEISWSTVRLADMIMTVAAVHGHDKASVQERRAWVLAVLAYGDGAAASFTKFAREASKGLGAKAAKKIPNAVLVAVNRAMGRTIVTKFGTKRGVVALGRLMPFGIGAGIGYGLNFALVEQVARHANRFFSQLPVELDAASA